MAKVSTLKINLITWTHVKLPRSIEVISAEMKNEVYI